MGYVRNLLVAVDQLGNTIAAGNPDATISGRTGYYANHAITTVRWYWIILQHIIDFTFWPVDGPNHCHESYHKEECEDYKPARGIVVMFLLSFIIIASCVPTAVILYLIKLIKTIAIK